MADQMEPSAGGKGLGELAAGILDAVLAKMAQSERKCLIDLRARHRLGDGDQRYVFRWTSRCSRRFGDPGENGVDTRAEIGWLSARVSFAANAAFSCHHHLTPSGAIAIIAPKR